MKISATALLLLLAIFWYSPNASACGEGGMFEEEDDCMEEVIVTAQRIQTSSGFFGAEGSVRTLVSLST